MAAELTLRDKLLALSQQAQQSAVAAARRGDKEGAMYCRGLRAYGTAAVFVYSGGGPR
jgi:hypothetical protein